MFISEHVYSFWHHLDILFLANSSFQNFKTILQFVILNSKFTFNNVGTGDHQILQFSLMNGLDRI